MLHCVYKVNKTLSQAQDSVCIRRHFGMVTMEEYLRREKEFADRHDSLCEHKLPYQCDCSQCPTKELCDWLDDNWVSVLRSCVKGK